MPNRFQLTETDRGHWEIRDSANDGYSVFRTTDAGLAKAKLTELNQLSASCDQLGIKLETRDDG